MEEKTNVIKLKFLRNGQLGGREYTYFTPELVLVGDLVDVSESADGISQGVVTAVNVPVAAIEPFKDRAKTIVGKAAEQQDEQDEAEAEGREKPLLDI